jgi:hypothetical protein
MTAQHLTDLWSNDDPISFSTVEILVNEDMFELLVGPQVRGTPVINHPEGQPYAATRTKILSIAPPPKSWISLMEATGESHSRHIIHIVHRCNISLGLREELVLLPNVLV